MYDKTEYLEAARETSDEPQKISKMLPPLCQMLDCGCLARDLEQSAITKSFFVTGIHDLREIDDLCRAQIVTLWHLMVMRVK